LFAIKINLSKKHKINLTQTFGLKELRKSEFLIAPEDTYEQGQCPCRPQKNKNIKRENTKF